MKILGFEITRTKALNPVSSGGGFWGLISEPFTGAWQRGVVEPDSRQNILAFSAVYACVSLIANDIAKLPLKLMEEVNGIDREIDRSSPYERVLLKPNRYQTRIQFINQWMTSKLIHGNTYVYKERDAKGIVTAMYILDPTKTQPLINDATGDVFYEIRGDVLAGVTNAVIVEASDIIHDRCVTLFHPLKGVSPIYACGASSTQGMRIQANAVRFFENMSRPSGMLTAPGAISDIQLEQLKKQFEQNFSGLNIGKLLVAGNGMGYQAMTVPAVDAQLIEQLRWTTEDVARCFGVPLYKLGGPLPTFNNAVIMNQDYYTQALQSHIESIELLLLEGLGLDQVPGRQYCVEMDLDCLLRMDPQARAETAAKFVGAGVWTPDEARAKEDMPPIDGGDRAYMQKQNWPLTMLGSDIPAANPPPPALPAPDNTASPAPAEARAAVEATRLIEAVRRGLPCLTAN